MVCREIIVYIIGISILSLFLYCYIKGKADLKRINDSIIEIENKISANEDFISNKIDSFV